MLRAFTCTLITSTYLIAAVASTFISGCLWEGRSAKGSRVTLIIYEFTTSTSVGWKALSVLWHAERLLDVHCTIFPCCIFAMEGGSIDSQMNSYFLVWIGMITKLSFCRFREPLFLKYSGGVYQLPSSLLSDILNCYLMTMNAVFAVDIMHFCQMLYT